MYYLYIYFWGLATTVSTRTSKFETKKCVVCNNTHNLLYLQCSMDNNMVNYTYKMIFLDYDPVLYIQICVIL